MNIYIQQIVINDLLKDVQLRMKLALVLNVTEQAVLKMAQRENLKENANSSLTKFAAILFLREQGYTDNQIFYIEQPSTTG